MIARAILQEGFLLVGLTGRAGKTETRKRYAKGYRVKTLYEECILKLDYEIDLGGLLKI